MDCCSDSLKEFRFQKMGSHVPNHILQVLIRRSTAFMRRTAPRKRGAWIRSNPELVFAFWIVLWTLVVYRRAIFNPFSAYDDLKNVVNNAELSSWSGIIYYLHTSVTFVGDLRGSGQSYFRPLFWMSLALDRSLWGLSPFAFHLTNLALHWLNGFLLFTLLKKLRVSRAIAGCTALVWLALPINSEVVAWISARAYLLAALFILAGAVLAQLYLEKQRPVFLVGYAFAALCAMFSYEGGILLLPLVVLIAYVMERPRARSALALYCVTFTAIALFFVVTHLVGPAGQYRKPPA